MGSVGVPFFDYYQFLGVASDASLDAINQAIASWEERNKRDRVHPDLHRDVDRREQRLSEARTALHDPTLRQAYDEEYNRRVAQRGDGLLWLDPEFIFDSNDDAPAYTVPSLAVKLDGDWPRAIEAVKGRAVEQMLRFVRPRQPAAKQPRYIALETEIGRLRVSLGETRPYQMLESTIVLCDARLPHADGRVNGQPIEGATLTTQTVRPDKPQTVRFRLSRATEVRGCLFGYAWVEDSWGSITSPAPEAFTADGKVIQGSYFELVGDGTAEFTISLPSLSLLALTRPETHQLHIALGLQPGTSHYAVARCHMPVAITPIPAKAAFEPSRIALPIARRGAVVTAKARLVNKGEAPLEAHQTPSPDAGVSVDDTLDATGGEVRVTVDTSNLPYGKPFEKSVVYRADGDVPSLTLVLVGELLPTAWQSVWRTQPARDRFTLAGMFALFALFLGPILAGLFASIPLALSLVCGLALTAGAIGVARVVPSRIVRHMRASGDTTISAASVPWRPIQIGAGVGMGIIALVIGMLPWDPWLHAYVYTCLGALIAAIWGFFFNEDLAVFKRPAGAKSLEGKGPIQLQSGWKAATILGAIVLGIVSIAFDPGLFGALLLFSLPVGMLIGLLAARSAAQSTP